MIQHKDFISLFAVVEPDPICDVCLRLPCLIVGGYFFMEFLGIFAHVHFVVDPEMCHERVDHKALPLNSAYLGDMPLKRSNVGFGSLGLKPYSMFVCS